MKHTARSGCILSGLLILLTGAICAPAAKALEQEASPWRTGVSLGWLDFEGDEPVCDGYVTSVRWGRDTSGKWTLEAVLDLVPELDESFRIDWRDQARISRLEERTEPGVHATSSARLSVDALRHLAPRKRVDPYIGAGAGVVWYEEDFDSQWEPAVRMRAGCEIRLNPALSIQADFCGMVAGQDTEINTMSSAGLVWKFGGPGTSQTALPPEKAPDENLQFFELQMNFDPGSSVIRAEYFSDLDAIGRILQADPGATARIEGHVERTSGARAQDERRLTLERAKAIQEYFERNLKISGGRLSAAGYGFDRPRAVIDPAIGSSQNNRMEIYIRSSSNPARRAPVDQ